MVQVAADDRIMSNESGEPIRVGEVLAFINSSSGEMEFGIALENADPGAPVSVRCRGLVETGFVYGLFVGTSSGK
jgi:hypothetical protein